MVHYIRYTISKNPTHVALGSQMAAKSKSNNNMLALRCVLCFELMNSQKKTQASYMWELAAIGYTLVIGGLNLWWIGIGCDLQGGGWV